MESLIYGMCDCIFNAYICVWFSSILQHPTLFADKFQMQQNKLKLKCMFEMDFNFEMDVVWGLSYEKWNFTFRTLALSKILQISP